MHNSRDNIFEKHSKLFTAIIISLVLLFIYIIFSIKIINQQSLKVIFKQYIAANIIDNNIGRFIKLREFSPNSIKSERPTKNYIARLDNQNLERKYYKLNIDQNGFIKPSNIHENPDLKIVFLGGSTTECLYMQEDERFVYKVGRNLEQKLAKKVNSYNGGVSANESMHSINILINKVLALKPNIVVIMHNINDLSILRTQKDYFYENSLKSHLQTSKNVFSKLEFPVRETFEFNPDLAKDYFRRNFKLFNQICKIHNITPVVMTQANRIDNDDLYHEFNQIIRDVAKEDNVLLIDLAKNIPASKDYLYDPVHYTNKGSQLAADLITEKIVSIL